MSAETLARPAEEARSNYTETDAVRADAVFQHETTQAISSVDAGRYLMRADTSHFSDESILPTREMTTSAIGLDPLANPPANNESSGGYRHTNTPATNPANGNAPLGGANSLAGVGTGVGGTSTGGGAGGGGNAGGGGGGGGAGNLLNALGIQGAFNNPALTAGTTHTTAVVSSATPSAPAALASTTPPQATVAPSAVPAASPSHPSLTPQTRIAATTADSYGFGSGMNNSSGRDNGNVSDMSGGFGSGIGFGMSSSSGSGSGAPFAFTEGLESGEVIVGSFTDPDGNTDSSQYSASVNWGDGQSSPAVVVYNNGLFQVYSGNTYPDEGTFPVSVSVSDADGSSFPLTNTAVVADAALTTGPVYGISATAGQPFSGPFGYFNDANTSAPVGDFTAQINWGDGQSSPGAVTASGGGSFLLGGTHTYVTAGSYPVSVSITDDGGSQTSFQTTATVTGSPPVANNDMYSVTEGSTLSVPAPGVLANDTDPNNLPLSAVLVEGAVNGSVQLNSNGSFTYTPNAGFVGTDYFGYYATDGQQNSNPATVTINVTASSSITVTNPGNQSSSEGDSVSLQVQASGGSGALSYGSSNLPSGLTIDSTTGLISGTIDYTAAEQQGGQYPVTITATDGAGDSGSASFTWYVADKNTPPALDNPGDQTNWQGDAVSLALSASDPDGDPLTYSGTGLPTGLTVNPTTGLISGVLAAPDGANSPYAVTVSASDGVNTVSQSFNWTVASVQIDPVADQNNLIDDSVSVAINAWGMSGQSLTYSAAGLPPGVSIDSTTGLISGTIANNASVTTPYNVAVTASDGTDSASTTFAWNVSNFTLDNPGDQTNAEGDAFSLQPSIETNGNPTLTFSASGLPNGLSINPSTGLVAGTIANLDSNGSPYSVTLSATDGTATSSQTFNWTVTHVLLPEPSDQINAPGDVVSLSIQARDPDNDPLTYTAAGLPTGLSINATTGLISGTIASTAGSDTPYSVTVTASDGTHTATGAFNWTVANEAVSVSNPGTQNNAEGDNVSLQINATDPSGDALSYTAAGLPAGLQIDYASGLISGTMDGSAAETNGGVYQVTVSADDGQGDNGSATFTWNVSHTNQAPTLDNPGDQVDRVGDAVSLPLTGDDGDGDTVSYAATGLPSGLGVDPTTGIISGTLPASAASATPYSVTVSASDGSLSASQTFNWSVTTNQVTLTSPGDQTNTEGDNVSLQLAASDANNSTLTYQVSGLPSGLSVNSSTGLITGTIAAGDAANGPYSVTIAAVDSSGYSADQQFTWNVNPANLNPVVSNPGAQINTQGDVLSLQIQATDPGGNGLTYGAAGLPPGLSIDPSSGLISGVLSNNSASGSPYKVTVTAADGSNSGSATFPWSVTNQFVTVTNPGTQSSSGGAAVSLPISASDSAQLPLTYAATGLPPGSSINATSGLISGTLAATDGGSYSVTVMAGDSQGNSGSATFTWNVTYLNQPPSLANPGDQLNNPGDVVSLQLSGSDVDGDPVTYSATGLPSGLSLDPNSGLISGTIAATAGSSTPYSVTATASDGTLTASQTFNWFVTSGVVTLTNPGDQTNSEGDNVSLQLSASDTAQRALTYAVSGLPAGLSLNSGTDLISGTVATGDAANGPYTVTVTATDTQGDSSAQQFTWNVNAPSNALTLTNPSNQSNAEGDSLSLQVQASDADGDTLAYAASGLPIGLMIDPTTGLISGTVDYSAAEISGGQYNVTVTVNDGNGDTASQSFVWAIAYTPQAPRLQYPEFQDSQAGTAASLQLVGGSPDDKTLTYSVTGLPTGLSMNASTGLISGTLTAAAGSYTVTAGATDTSNLSASQTFTWQVTSGTAPQVLISFDGEPVGDDYLTGVGPSAAIPVTVTLENASPGTHTITLSIPSGESAVSQSTFQSSDGGSQTIELTPEEESQSFDDVLLVAYVGGQEAGDGKGMNVKVKIDPVRDSDTPAGMEANRISVLNKANAMAPPWAKISVNQPELKGNDAIVYKVEGGSATNGQAGVSGDASNDPQPGVVYQKTGAIGVIGTTQTMPSIGGDGRPNFVGGNAGKLVIVAYAYNKKTKIVGAELGRSTGFSVAAIPIKIILSKQVISQPKAYPQGGQKPGEQAPWNVGWSAVYFQTDVSDSGDPADLKYVQIGERLFTQADPTGYYGGDGVKYKAPVNVIWNAFGGSARDPGNTDLVGEGRTVNAKTETEAIAGAYKEITALLDKLTSGTLLLDQIHVFADAQLGIPLGGAKGNPLVAGSGFQHLEIIQKKKDGRYYLHISLTANGNHDAKAGEIADVVKPVDIEIKLVPNSVKG